MLPEPIAAALTSVLDGLEGRPVRWALTGSAAFALRGIPLPPNDIDLQTTAAGAYTIEKIFQSAIKQPVRFKRSPQLRSHLGALLIGGVKVEIIGDVQKKLPDGSWTPPPDLEKIIQLIHWKNRAVPVLPLAYEAESYRLMGRSERAEMLSAYREMDAEKP